MGTPSRLLKSALAAVLLLGIPMAPVGAQPVVATWGGAGLDWAGDMAVAPDGDLVLVGALHGDVALPTGAVVHTLVESARGDHQGFVARLTPDGQRVRWVTLFPPQTFVPSRVAVDDDRIALAGDPLERMGAQIPSTTGGSWDRGAVVVLSADGTRLVGARPGPPNSPRGIRTSSGAHAGYEAGITGLTLHDDTVYVTASTSGSGQGAYIVRYDATTLLGVDFSGRPDPARTWSIDLRHNAPDLVDALTWRYDHTHPDATYHQGSCRISLRGNRRGGQVVVTDYDGGTIFGTFDIQYDFNCGSGGFPAFDAGIAAWDLDGRLKWATNALDRMVSEPDQGPLALVWDPVRERLVVALWQHGSNVARLPGTLVGDTGNISVGWVGVLDPDDGGVDHAWYQHAVRQDSNGNWAPDGTVQRWPQNSGNSIHRISLDGDGRVYVLARGGNQMFTTADAWQDWPRDLWGGHTTLTVLAPDLSQTVYATTFRGAALDSGGSTPAGVAVNAHGVYLFGRTGAADFVQSRPDAAPWQTPWGGNQDLFLAQLTPDDLPFVPSALTPIPDAPAPGDDDTGVLPTDDTGRDTSEDAGQPDDDTSAPLPDTRDDDTPTHADTAPDRETTPTTPDADDTRPPPDSPPDEAQPQPDSDDDTPPHDATAVPSDEDAAPTRARGSEGCAVSPGPAPLFLMPLLGLLARRRRK